MELQEDTSHKRVIYCLPQIDRIGQLAVELFFLRNVYPESEYQLTVITYPPEQKPKTNLAVYEFFSRGLAVRHTTDDNIIWFTHRNREVLVTEHDNTIYFLDSSKLMQRFVALYTTNRRFNYKPAFNESDLKKGMQLREKLGIPLTSPVVTLHVREGGYLPEYSYHSYRDCTVDNYLPAIKYLTDLGYYVVRLGDSTMKPIADSVTGLVDLPFHRAYEPFADLYFLGSNTFHISSGSGPSCIAQAFGAPCLFTNAALQDRYMALDPDLFVPKKYLNKNKNRYLSLREILCSPLVEYYKAEEFAEAGVELHENSPGEIHAAVREFEARCANNYSPDNQMEEKISGILHAAQSLREFSRPDRPLYMSLIDSRFSNEFYRQNPDLLL